jgi:hypothetical protein
LPGDFFRFLFVVFFASVFFLRAVMSWLLMEMVVDGTNAIVGPAESCADRHTGAIRVEKHQERSGNNCAELRVWAMWRPAQAEHALSGSLYRTRHKPTCATTQRVSGQEIETRTGRPYYPAPVVVKNSL